MASGLAFSQWTTTGSNIYYNTGNVGIGTSSFSANGLLTLNRAPTAAFGSPILQIGGSSYTSGGYYSVGLGYTDATYTEPPAEIAYVATSDSGGTKGAIVFGNRDVTTNTAVTERMRIDSSGNVGIGTNSPAASHKLTIKDAGSTGGIANIKFESTTAGVTNGTNVGFTALGFQPDFQIWNGDAGIVRIATNNTERMRVASTGQICWGNAVALDGWITQTWNGQSYVGVVLNNTGGGSVAGMRFKQSGTTVGEIGIGTSSTSYNTTSDYRLKENVAPMTGALATVTALKPCTYTWKVDGSAGQGFIAHELQAVVPDCVTGEKDAVETYTDADGVERTRPLYQGVDTSFLVATLTAAIQELKAELDAAKERIAVLESNNGTL